MDKKNRKFNEEESQKINLDNFRIDFKDTDENNRNLETKTNYMAALNVVIYSIVFYFLNLSSFKITSKGGIIAIILFTIFIIIDFILISKNLIPTSFRKIPICEKEQNKEVYLNSFYWCNFINSSKTEEKANNLKYILVSFFFKIILILIAIILFK